MNKLLYNTRFLYRGTRHFIFFGFTVLLFTVILYLQNGTDGFTHALWLTFSNALFFFAYAYITIFLLIPEFLIKRKIAWFFLLFTLVGIGLSALKLAVSDYIFYASISPESIERNGVVNLRFMVMNTKDMTFIVALFCVAKYAKDYLYTEGLRKKLEQQNQEAKSKLLQSQFDPHFMFNTINNLYALSLLNPQKTNTVIRKMKTVLTYITAESKKGFVPLENELALVKNYIQLEKIRYGKRLKVDFDINGNTTNVKIPPMVLFLLIENSFKHGSSIDAGTPWIKLKVDAEPGKVTLLAKNSKPKTVVQNTANYEKGKGFKGLIQRLDIIYEPKGYQLTIDDNDEWFSVNLVLKEKIELRQNTYR